MQNEHLNQSQLARHLGVDRVTVWRWIKDGKLTPSATLPSGRHLYSPTEALGHARKETTEND